MAMDETDEQWLARMATIASTTPTGIRLLIEALDTSIYALRCLEGGDQVCDGYSCQSSELGVRHMTKRERAFLVCNRHTHMLYEHFLVALCPLWMWSDTPQAQLYYVKVRECDAVEQFKRVMQP
jgi:hypothetical protein